MLLHEPLLNQKKSQRFTELPVETMAAAIGEALESTGLPERVCRVCQRHIPEKEVKETKRVAADAAADERKCALCMSFEQLGSALSNAAYLAISRISPQMGHNNRWDSLFHHFGADVQVLRQTGPTAKAWQETNSSFVQISYWTERPEITEFPGWPGDSRTTWGFRPLAQAVPLDESGETATFSDLKSEGIERWGVLRMDVDNLGTIFQQGIQPPALARSVGLSGLMRLFFEGYVPQIVQEMNRQGAPRVQLMYAGGDDLFIVGGWSWLPQLAKKIRDEFVKFACGNPKVTLSGGVSIALAEKYPLYQAARDAGTAEHKAKEFGTLKNGEHEKDAFALLEEPVSWKEVTADGSRTHTYGWAHGWTEQLKEWLQRDEKRLPRAFLMSLRAIEGEWQEWKKQERGEKQNQPSRYQHGDKTLYFGPWQWHLVYSLERAAERTKDEAVKEQVRELVQEILGGGIERIGLVARWTELWTRDKKEKGDSDYEL